MSDYDLFGDYEPERPATLEEEKPRRPPRRKKPSGGGGGPYKFLATLFLIGTIGLAVFVVIVLMNPNSSMNPFRPPTPEPTPTLMQFPAGNVPITPQGTTAAARFPTSVPNITATPSLPALVATGFTPLPGGTLTVSVLPFTLQNDAVTYRTHPDGCKGLWLIGQVFDIDGAPLPGLPVQVTGSVFQGAIEFTGSAPRWGESGYEFELNSTPVEDQFVVQLLNTTGQPLSEPVVVKTLASCEQNVAVVNFIQNHPFSK